jgi:hypothetical protein
MLWLRRGVCHKVFFLHRVHVNSSMFSHQPHPKRVREPADFERFPSHRSVIGDQSNLHSNRMKFVLPVQHICVANDSSEFGVSVTFLRALIDVSTAYNSYPVIHDADLRTESGLGGWVLWPQRLPWRGCTLVPLSGCRHAAWPSSRAGRRSVCAVSCSVAHTSRPSFRNRLYIECGPRKRDLF